MIKLAVVIKFDNIISHLQIYMPVLYTLTILTTNDIVYFRICNSLISEKIIHDMKKLPDILLFISQQESTL